MLHGACFLRENARFGPYVSDVIAYGFGFLEVFRQPDLLCVQPMAQCTTFCTAAPPIPQGGWGVGTGAVSHAFQCSLLCHCLQKYSCLCIFSIAVWRGGR